MCLTRASASGTSTCTVRSRRHPPGGWAPIPSCQGRSTALLVCAPRARAFTHSLTHSCPSHLLSHVWKWGGGDGAVRLSCRALGSSGAPCASWSAWPVRQPLHLPRPCLLRVYVPVCFVCTHVHVTRCHYRAPGHWLHDWVPTAGQRDHDPILRGGAACAVRRHDLPRPPDVLLRSPHRFVKWGGGGWRWGWEATCATHK